MGYRFYEDILQVPGDILVMMSTVELDAGSHMDPHIHHTLELSMVVSGSGEYHVNDTVYPVNAGDIVLFNNNELHYMSNTGTNTLLNVALEFDPQFIWSDPVYTFDQAFLAAFFNRSPKFRHKLDRDNPMYAAIQGCFEEIRQEIIEQPPRYEIMVKAKLLTILANLLRYYDMTNADTHAIPARYQADMAQVLSYIAGHYAEPLSLKGLADMVHLHPTHFSRLFHAANGLTPKEYIIRVRVAAVSQLLKTSDADILEIAQTCGFNSPSNFYETFKRITGKSPAQYRAAPTK